MDSARRILSLGQRAHTTGKMVSKYITPEIANRIEFVCKDPLPGATFLAQEALRVMALAAEALPPGEEKIDALKQLGQQMARARPAMASVKNMVGRFIEAMESGGGGVDPHVLEQELIGQMEGAAKECAGRAAELVYEGARVLTCSFSSAVLRTFKDAVDAGKRFSVAAIESRWRELAYGEVLLEEVTALGIPVVLVPDDGIIEGVSAADMVIVGADKLLPGGLIVNGWPTLRTAEAARGSIPFYSVCESYKLDTDPLIQEGFDTVPACLITGVITDSQ